jgi:uncharacterized membrane protein
MRQRFSPDDSKRLIGSAAGIGAIAGLRSMTAPAVVSWAANQEWIESPAGPLSFFHNKKTASIFSALAAGELVADKLPNTPSRTMPAGLASRILTGSLSGAALCASKGKLVGAGAIAGGLGAVAGAFIGYQARRRLRERLQVSDTVIAVAEDALAISGGVLIVRSV